MRGLLLLWFIAAANSAHLGYDYRTSGRHVAAGSELTSSGSGRGSSSESDAIDNNNNNNNNKNDARSELSSRLGGLTGGATNAVDLQLHSDAVSVSEQNPSAEFNKQFYSYAAPKDDFNDVEAMQRIASSLKRNLRVVFIRSPEHQGLTNAALQLAKQANEDRTAIYVLSKQADVGELAQRLQSVRNDGAHKPEVHFVKYRTQDDALRAQQQIQAQYESLAGSSRSSNEGVAPVLDFATSLSSAEGDTRSLATKSTYLPPTST